MLSSSVEAFEGARVAVLQDDGLFRLDAVVVPDNLRLAVRNLSSLPLAFEPDGYPRPVLVQGGDLGELALIPGHHQIAFRLGDEDDAGAVDVRVVLATVRVLEQGTVRITAQALMRTGSPDA